MRDSRVRVFHQENGGQLSARLCGLTHARGEFAVFLDADDLLAPLALSRLYEVINACSADAVIYRLARFTEQPPTPASPVTPPQIIADKRELCLAVLLDYTRNSLCCKAVRRSLLPLSLSEKYFAVRYGEDLLQTLDLLAAAPRTVLLGEELYFYRDNPNSVTNCMDIVRNVEDELAVRTEVLHFLTGAAVFSEQDMQVYRTYAVQIFCDVIGRIGKSPLPAAEKRALYKKIKESEYYRNFLSQKTGKLPLRKRPVWFLFRYGLYAALHLFYKVKK